MYSYDFFSLIDKKTNTEVYTAPAAEYTNVFKIFTFYFDRINSGIAQQLQSPRTTEEQKKSLKYIGPADFLIALKTIQNSGGYSYIQHWINDLQNFNEINTYNFQPISN